MKTPRKNKIRKELKMKRCAYCYATKNLTLDHKHPKILGGTDDKKNLQCLCKRCNQMKSKIPHGVLMGIFKWYETIKEEKEKREDAHRANIWRKTLPDYICSLPKCTTCQDYRKIHGFGVKARTKL